jgi:hypothetical protein
VGSAGVPPARLPAIFYCVVALNLRIVPEN